MSKHLVDPKNTLDTRGLREPANRNELEQLCKEEWAKIPPE